MRNLRLGRRFIRDPMTSVVLKLRLAVRHWPLKLFGRVTKKMFDKRSS